MISFGVYLCNIPFDFMSTWDVTTFEPTQNNKIEVCMHIISIFCLFILNLWAIHHCNFSKQWVSNEHEVLLDASLQIYIHQL